MTTQQIIDTLKTAGVYAWADAQGNARCNAGTIYPEGATPEGVTKSAAHFLAMDYRCGNFPTPKRARRRR